MEVRKATLDDVQILVHPCFELKSAYRNFHSLLR